MKARKNPTNEQLLRRMRRPPESSHDLRFKNDAYYAARFQGYPHAVAKTVFRDQPPIISEHVSTGDLGEYADADEIFFPAGSKYVEIKIESRPELTESSILHLQPRKSEYTVWDKQIERFGVRVRPSGHMTYIVNYRIRNRNKLFKYTIGKITEFSLEQARSVAREMKRDARMGIDPQGRMREHAKQL